MGYQVIRQPDGKLAIFSSYTDTWCESNLRIDEVINFFVDRAVADTYEHMDRVLSAVLTGQPSRVYYQFAMSFDEAEVMSAEHGGPVLADPKSQSEL
jgi:hypothetical protein